MTRRSAARHPHLRQAFATMLVAVAACLVAVWVAPRASGAAAEWLRTPTVRLHTLTMPGDGRLLIAAPTARGAAAVSLDAGMRFSMAGVVCDVPGAGAVTVRVRTSLDGSAWGPWMETPLEVVDEGGVARAFTDPLWTGAARYAQVAAVAGDGGGPAGTDQGARGGHRPGGGRRGRRPRRRRAAPHRRRDRRRRPRAAGLGGRHRAADRHARRVGRGRVAAFRVTRLRARQDGLRPPHRQRQRLHASRRPRAHARRLRLPHQEPGLERHRLQLPRGPLRDHLRGTVRRHGPRRHRRAGLRLQHRQHRHLGDGDVHRGGATDPGGHRARAAARVEALHQRT